MDETNQKLKKKQGEVSGVAQILNARSSGGFDQQDLEVFKENTLLR